MFKYERLVAQTAFEAAESGSSAHIIRYDPWRGRWMHLISVLARNSVLLFCDLSALLIASMLGYVAWAEAILHQPASQYFSLLPLLCLFPFAYAAAGLYPGFGLGAVEILRRLFYCTSISFLG